MSGNDGGGEPSIPFGFQFVGGDEHQPHQQPQSHEDAHQSSLLDNNETRILRDFFNNPNNIDPAFLALTQGQRPQEQDPYGAASQQQWFMPPQEQGQHGASSSHQTSPVQPFGQQQMPTDDVYAAARLLHSNQTAFTNGAMGAQGLPAVTHAPQAQMYGYNQPPQPGFIGQSSAAGQGSPTGPSMYPGMMSQSRPQSSRQQVPLNFGSDSKFHGHEYAGSSTHRPPDQELMQIVSTFQHDTEGSPTQARQQMPLNQPQSPSQPRRKRRRSSAVEDDSEDSEEAAPRKKGKGKARAKDDSGEDSGEPTSGGRGRKSKAASSPGRRRKSEVTSKKPARENLTEAQKRENHIQSEQKRRNLIKMGFEDTNRMVPELRAGGFSKSNMLQEAAKFMRELKEGNNRLAAMLGMLDKG